MPVVFGDAVEAAPTNETAGVAKVAIPACRGNVRCARVHVSMAGLVWLLLAVHFSRPSINGCADCAMLSKNQILVPVRALVLTYSARCKYTLSRELAPQ